MSLATKIKNELNQLGIKPKKSLGQNFLINEGVYDKIIAALELKPGETVLEIGSGLGILTEYLVTAGGNVIGVEKDHQLAEHLKTKFADEKRVNIKEDDILKFNPQDTKYKVIGNIPYYLTSHLLRIIFENWPKPELIVLMIQKEVAQRIVAKPPNMSLLAVLVQYYASPKIISYVSSGSFYPTPEVDSAIIKLVPRVQGVGSSEKESEKFRTEPYTLNPKPFFRIVSAGFAKKRKQLINNLSAGLKMEREIIEQKLLSAQIDPQRRAETLTIEEWQKITNILFTRD